MAEAGSTRPRPGTQFSGWPKPQALSRQGEGLDGCWLLLQPSCHCVPRAQHNKHTKRTLKKHHFNDQTRNLGGVTSQTELPLPSCQTSQNCFFFFFSHLTASSHPLLNPLPKSSTHLLFVSPLHNGAGACYVNP